jgi:photosystem II stability/assembly factor-like uncharacterized protein
MKRLQSSLLACVVILLAPAAVAAADWEPTTVELLKSVKTGFGGLCGLVVDHATGTIYVDLSDRGLYRSTDQGKSWQATSADLLRGRTEWPGCLMLDPTGQSKRLVSALVYGAPISSSADGGKTWEHMHAASSHVDWFALDWSDRAPTFILALKHESGDLLIVSRDGGKSFKDVGKGFGPAWVFDSKTAVVAVAKTKDRPRPNLLRTDDAGMTFQPCGDYATRALPRWNGNTLFWVVDGALISSADKGKTWTNLGVLKDGRYGPIFGKDERQMFVLTGAGIVESTDRGATWSEPLALPKEVKGGSPLTWIEFDPANDVLYAMKMGSQLYRLERRK